MVSSTNGPTSNEGVHDVKDAPMAEASLRPIITHALRPTIIELRDQLSHMAQQQADLSVGSIRETFGLYLNRAFEAARQALCQEVTDAVELGRIAMQVQANEILDSLEASRQGSLKVKGGPPEPVSPDQSGPIGTAAQRTMADQPDVRAQTGASANDEHEPHQPSTTQRDDEHIADEPSARTESEQRSQTKAPKEPSDTKHSNHGLKSHARQGS